MMGLKKIPFWVISLSMISLELLMYLIAFIVSLKLQLNAGIESLSPGMLVFGLYPLAFLILIILIQAAKVSQISKDSKTI